MNQTVSDSLAWTLILGALVGLKLVGGTYFIVTSQRSNLARMRVPLMIACTIVFVSSAALILNLFTQYGSDQIGDALGEMIDAYAVFGWSVTLGVMMLITGPAVALGAFIRVSKSNLPLET